MSLGAFVQKNIQIKMGSGDIKNVSPFGIGKRWKFFGG